MTVHIFVRDASAQETLSSRPERSEVEGPAVDPRRLQTLMEASPYPLSSRVVDGPQAACGPPKEMKNTFCPATALHGSVALPFVIPSEAEGSAVSAGSSWKCFLDRAKPSRGTAGPRSCQGGPLIQLARRLEESAVSSFGFLVLAVGLAGDSAGFKAYDSPLARPIA